MYYFSIFFYILFTFFSLSLRCTNKIKGVTAIKNFVGLLKKRNLILNDEESKAFILENFTHSETNISEMVYFNLF